MRFPWYFPPWTRIGQLRLSNARMEERLNEYAGQLGSEKALNRQLHRQIEDMRRKQRLPLDPRSAGYMDRAPEFVLVGMDQPGRGKRVYASRDLPQAKFGMTEMSDPPPRWKLTTVMDQMLVHDDKDYSAALSRIMQIWANRDAGSAANRKVLEGEAAESGFEQHTGSWTAASGAYMHAAAERLAIETVEPGDGKLRGDIEP